MAKSTLDAFSWMTVLYWWGLAGRQSPAVKYSFSWENQPACISTNTIHLPKFPSLPLSIPSPQSFDPDVH